MEEELYEKFEKFLFCNKFVTVHEDYLVNLLVHLYKKYNPENFRVYKDEIGHCSTVYFA